VKFAGFEKTSYLLKGFRILLDGLRYGIKPKLFPFMFCLFVQRDCMPALCNHFRYSPVLGKHETFFYREPPEFKESISNWYVAWAALLAGIAGGAEPESII